MRFQEAVILSGKKLLTKHRQKDDRDITLHERRTSRSPYATGSRGASATDTVARDGLQEAQCRVSGKETLLRHQQRR